MLRECYLLDLKTLLCSFVWSVSFTDFLFYVTIFLKLYNKPNDANVVVINSERLCLIQSLVDGTFLLVLY